MELAEKGCTEELRGMPGEEFRKAAMRDCVCRIQIAAGKPCSSLAEEARNAQEDSEFTKQCKDQQKAAAEEPAIHAAGVRKCLCNWAKGVLPSLCLDHKALKKTRRSVGEMEADCKKGAKNTRGVVSAAQRKAAVSTCTCKKRKEANKGVLSGCLSHEEWVKLQAAVTAQHATCGKLNRRRRGNTKTEL